jgi:hypothetical protein
MLGADTVISGIIRLVTTVGILAAVYFLIIKPVLHTTESISHDVNHSVNHAAHAADVQAQRAQVSGDRQRALAYASSALAGTEPWYAASRMLKSCVRHAGNDARKMHACANTGEHLTTVFSPRIASLSYADSVAAQGNSAGAASIRSCVSKAGFKPVPMLHCKDQGYKLVFGG